MKDILCDLLLAIAVLAGAGLLFVGASDLPAPRFEPMGSAALPRILASLLVLFAVVLGAGALRRYFGSYAPPLSLTPTDSASTESNSATESASSDTYNGDDRNSSPDSIPGGNTIRAAVLFAGLVAYVFVLDKLQWPFVPATTVFVMFVGTLLSKPSYRSASVFFIFGLVLSFGIHTIFTQFLYVDLG